MINLKKRALAIVLAMVLLVSVFAVTAVSVYAENALGDDYTQADIEEETDDVPPDEDVTVPDEDVTDVDEPTDADETTDETVVETTAETTVATEAATTAATEAATTAATTDSKKTNSPKTGDSSLIFVGLGMLALALAGIAFTAKKRAK